MAHPVVPARRTYEAEDSGDATVLYYDREAEAYFRSTLANDLTNLYRLFLARVPAGGLILDAGSGSGRDTLAFLSAGYRVEAFDASRGLAALAEEMTGVPVDVVRFEDWHGKRDRYDGIWCFASLLHVKKPDLPGVLTRLAASLRPGGSLFASFKRGDEPNVDDRGRRFTNLTPEAARALFDGVEGLEVSNVWDEGGPTALGNPTIWVYVLARRPD